MAKTGNLNLIDLSDSDLDLPIYRIYKLDRFIKMMSTGRDALVNPQKWEDPFENFFLRRTEIVDDVSGRAIQLKNLADDWYGQCWSFHEETDAMWRIYSPDPVKSIGVKVRTTCRRLFKNLKRVDSEAPYLQFFIGRVTYFTQQEILSLMGKLTFSNISAGGQGDKFAGLLCVKRDTFEHEQEVRLLFQDVALSAGKRGRDSLFEYALDSHALFDEVVLDPRLKDLDFVNIKDDLKVAGCRIPISKSMLYDVPRFVIPFE